MSIEAMSHVLSARVGDTTSKLVLLAYANHAAKDGTAAWPGKAAVAAYAECDPKTVQRHLRKLEAAGWLRRGDQELVSHLRADRRPVVYDVAMREDVRLAWARDAERGDDLPPRDEDVPVDNATAREDNPPPRPDDHGGTPETSRGDTAVSTKPSRTIQIPPSPTADAAGVTDEADTITGCPAHPGGRPNCRFCGTTPRQLAAAAQRAASARSREAARRRLQQQRDQAKAHAADPARARESITAARAAVDETRRALQGGTR